MYVEMTVEFSHERLTESHDLALRHPRVVRTALTTSNRETGQGILKRLFEAKEFDNADVNGRVKTKSPS